MNQEHCKPNWERSQDWNMWVSGIFLGTSCKRERCRQGQRCPLSQHQAQQAWSSQKPQHWFHHPASQSHVSGTPSPYLRHRWHPGTAWSCRTRLGLGTTFLLRAAQMSPLGLCALLRYQQCSIRFYFGRHELKQLNTWTTANRQVFNSKPNRHGNSTNTIGINKY